MRGLHAIHLFDRGMQSVLNAVLWLSVPRRSLDFGLTGSCQGNGFSAACRVSALRCAGSAQWGCGVLS